MSDILNSLFDPRPSSPQVTLPGFCGHLTWRDNAVVSKNTNELKTGVPVCFSLTLSPALAGGGRGVAQVRVRGPGAGGNRSV